jgi:MFS family permease
MAMCNQWQRYLIGYAKAIGTKKNDPVFEISTAYPNFDGQYGILAGFAFTSTYATFGIFGGVLSDKTNRKVLMALSCICWSLTTMLSGIIDSFPAFYALRFGLGFFQSAFNPCAYSVISDYFHPDRRTLANSIFNLGIYFGGALSSITSAYINVAGWRSAYTIVC